MSTIKENDTYKYLSNDTYILNNKDFYCYINLPKNLNAGDKFILCLDISTVLSGTIEFIQCTHDAKISNKSGKKNINITDDIVQIELENFYLNFDKEQTNLIVINFNTKNELGDYVKSYWIKKKFSIYGNCQPEHITCFLLTNKNFRKYYEYIEPVGRLVHIMNNDDIKNYYRTLSKISLLIVQPISDTYNNNHLFGTTSLLNYIKSYDVTVIMIPNLYFSGYSPHVRLISYKNNFLLHPMPIHDINFLKIYKDNNRNREKIIDEYIRIINDPNFYNQKYFEEQVNKSLTELESRENEAIKKYGHLINKFIKYSDFVKENYKNVLLCHFPSHPAQFTFIYISNIILNFINITPENYDVNLDPGKSGVLPFYKSIEKNLNFSITDKDIIVNSYKYDIKQFMNEYCDAYDKYDINELEQYIKQSQNN